MLLKCCTQYISKFGNLSSGYRIGKGQFSLQSQRKVAPENVQTSIQFHMLARWCTKSFKLGFSSIWAENFQMYKLAFEEAEESNLKQIGLPTFWDLGERGEFQKNIYFFFIDYTKAFDCVDHSKLWKVLKEMVIPDHFICLLKNLYTGQEAMIRSRHGTWTVKN